MSAFRISSPELNGIHRRNRDADTDVGDDLMALDLVGLDHQFADALRERGGVGGLLHLRHDDGELVAAHACDHVELARAAAQTLADKLEQLVADMVSERVIDALEVVEVEAKHRQALAALDALDLVVELLEQQRPVREVGQRIVPCHVRDAFLRALALGDVFVGCQPAAAREGLVHNRESAPVRKVHDLIEGLAFGDAFLEACDVFVDIARETAELHPVLEEVAQEASRFNDFRRKTVQFDITLVAKN